MSSLTKPTSILNSNQRMTNQTASSSSSPATLSLLPSNVVSIFLATFHVRHGNQIDFQYPPFRSTNLIDTDDIPQHTDGNGIDLTGVEWKVLPSGGHLIQRDVIYFQPNQPGTVGVASFRNVKLDQHHTDAQGQRGARMLSVGIVLECPKSTSNGDCLYPTANAQQLAIVPHLYNLEKLSEKLADKPQDYQPLLSYYRVHSVHKAAQESHSSPGAMRQLRMRRRSGPKNQNHDPTTHLPAMCGALGPLLPRILKKLMVPGHRLLIFSPSPPLVHAAYIGYNLADLVTQAFPSAAKRDALLRQLVSQAIVQVRGQISVHDITTLEDEEKARTKQAQSQTQTQTDRATKSVEAVMQSWIAWSSDKILLEKPHLFDSVLDLIPLVGPSSGEVLDESTLEHSNLNPKLCKVVRTRVSADGSRYKAELKQQTGTTREFATFNELDAQAERHAERITLFGHDMLRRKKSSRQSIPRNSQDEQRKRSSYLDSQHDHALYEEHNPMESMQEADEVTKNSAVSQWMGGCGRATKRTKGGSLSVMLAFLRHWLASWWFIPSHWRYRLPSTYVLPLGIRGDGGVRSSIMILPDETSDVEEEEEEEEDDGEDEDDEEKNKGEGLKRKEEPKNQAKSSNTPSHDDSASTLTSAAAALALEASQAQQLDGAAPEHTESTSTGSAPDEMAVRPAPPDPLLAAVGASFPEVDRMSHTSSLRVRRRFSIDRLSHATDGNDNRFDDDDAIHLHTVLSDSLWTVWSRWTTALVVGLLDLVQDELLAETDQSVNTASDGLLSQQQLILTPKQVASLGLSAGTDLDVELIESLGHQIACLVVQQDTTDFASVISVRVERGWPILRWLL